MFAIKFKWKNFSGKQFKTNVQIKSKVFNFVVCKYMTRYDKLKVGTWKKMKTFLIQLRKKLSTKFLNVNEFFF